MKHFQEEIDRVASLELKQIEEEKERLQKEALEDEERKLESMFHQRILKKRKALEKDYARKKASVEMAYRQEVYRVRDDLQASLKGAVRKELLQYIQSQDYITWMEECFSHHPKGKIYISEHDEKHMQKWSTMFPLLQFEVSSKLILGGYQWYDESQSIYYDDTFDVMYEEIFQQSLFPMEGGLTYES